MKLKRETLETQVMGVNISKQNIRKTKTDEHDMKLETQNN